MQGEEDAQSTMWGDPFRGLKALGGFLVSVHSEGVTEFVHDSPFEFVLQTASARGVGVFMGTVQTIDDALCHALEEEWVDLGPQPRPSCGFAH
jgi:hypothetical protein